MMGEESLYTLGREHNLTASTQAAGRGQQLTLLLLKFNTIPA